MDLKRLTLSVCAFTAIGLLACASNPGNVPTAPTAPAATATRGTAPTATTAAQTATTPTAQAQATQPTTQATQPAGGGGNVAEGTALFTSKGCIACHTVQSIPAARGTIGPELTKVSTNSQVAGTLPMSEQSIKTWLANPPGVKPGTAMPNLGLSPQEINNLTAFLLTLK